MKHEHTWALFNIAMLGYRYQCTDPRCNKIAPACFQPKETERVPSWFKHENGDIDG